MAAAGVYGPQHRPPVGGGGGGVSLNLPPPQHQYNQQAAASVATAMAANIGTQVSVPGGGRTAAAASSVPCTSKTTTITREYEQLNIEPPPRDMEVVQAEDRTVVLLVAEALITLHADSGDSAIVTQVARPQADYYSVIGFNYTHDITAHDLMRLRALTDPLLNDRVLGAKVSLSVRLDDYCGGVVVMVATSKSNVSARSAASGAADFAVRNKRSLNTPIDGSISAAAAAAAAPSAEECTVTAGSGPDVVVVVASTEPSFVPSGKRQAASCSVLSRVGQFFLGGDSDDDAM